MSNKTTKRLDVDNDVQPLAEPQPQTITNVNFSVIQPGGTMYTNDASGQRIIVNLGSEPVEVNGQMLEPATSDELKAVYDLGHQYAHIIQAPPGYQPPWELPAVQASGCESC